MDPHDVAAYADKVFGFCMNRLHHIENARDLSQEILCEALAALQRCQPEQPEAWLWGIAHNCYCRWLRRQKHTVLLVDDSALETLPAAEAPEDTAQQQAVFAALHTLAASHREIMVDFYVSGLSCEAIARKHRLPVKTVRTRLFYGREKLKERWQIKMEENRIYHQHEWFITGNGNVNTALLRRQAARSILTACYEQYQTIDQLSLATGIPAMYIEDELQPLAEAEAVDCRQGKYRANMIIHREGFAARAEALLLAHARELAQPLGDVLEQLLPQAQAICSLPGERLCWSLIPMLLREAITLARAKQPDLVRGPFPLRRDGSNGWLCAYLSPGGAHRYFSGCNAYYRSPSRFRYYWSHDLYSEELNQLLLRLEDRNPGCAFPADELLAECIRCDLVARRADGLSWNIPVLSASEADALKSALLSPAAALAGLLMPAVESLYRLMREEVPVHLHDQIRGVFGIEFNSIIAMLCEMLLPRPRQEIFAGQVVMLGEPTEKL